MVGLWIKLRKLKEKITLDSMLDLCYSQYGSKSILEK